MLHQSPKRNTFSLAGWLFADLLLGLSVFFMITTPAQKPDPTPYPTPTNLPTATNTPTLVNTPTPAATPTPLPTEVGPIGLSKAQCYNLDLSESYLAGQPEEMAIVSQMKDQIPNNTDVRAGLVLIWGHGESIYEGRQIAMRVGNTLSEQFPLSFGKGTEKKSMGFEYGNLKHVQVEVYFFTTNPWQSGKEVPCEFIN